MMRYRLSTFIKQLGRQNLFTRLLRLTSGKSSLCIPFTSLVRRVLLSLIAPLFILLPHVAAASSAENIPRIAFLVDDNSGNYQSILKGFREYTRKHAGRLVRYDIINNEKLTPTELQQEIARDYRLLVTLGSKNTRDAIVHAPDMPVFALLVNQAELLALHRATSKENREVSGIFQDQPFERFAALIKASLPQYRRVGLLLSQNTKTLKPMFEKSMTANGLTPIVNIARTNDLPQRVLERLALKCDVIVAIFDDKVYAADNVKSHLLTAFRHQIPVIGVTRSYTDVGAVASIYTDYFELGKQTAKQILKMIDDHDKPLAPVYPESFAVKVNPYVMRSFGITNVGELELRQAISQHTLNKSR